MSAQKASQVITPRRHLWRMTLIYRRRYCCPSQRMLALVRLTATKTRRATKRFVCQFLRALTLQFGWLRLRRGKYQHLTRLAPTETRHASSVTAVQSSRALVVHAPKAATRRVGTASTMAVQSAICATAQTLMYGQIPSCAATSTSSRHLRCLRRVSHLDPCQRDGR